MAQTGPVRRANVVVRDMARALAFYRDLLGWTVFFNEEVAVGPAGHILNVRCRGVHMAVLRADDGQVGMMGFMQYLDPTFPMEDSPIPQAVRAGEPYIVLQSPTFDDLMHQLREAGTYFVCEPFETQLAKGTVRECAVRDPDGLMINIVDTSNR